MEDAGEDLGGDFEEEVLVQGHAARRGRAAALAEQGESPAEKAEFSAWRVDPWLPAARRAYVREELGQCRVAGGSRVVLGEPAGVARF